MTKEILLLPGDGIGLEVLSQAERVLRHVLADTDEVQLTTGLIGGAAIDATGEALPPQTIAAIDKACAVLLGAVGAPQYDSLPPEKKPEKGLLNMRAQMGVYANFRPAFCYPCLSAASPLKAEQVSGLDILIVRELIGGIYFGQPRGLQTRADGVREAFNTMRYDEQEIARVARKAFTTARSRKQRLCSVDKANVLEVSVLWREIVSKIGEDEFSDIELTHLYVDNAAMQLAHNPRQFDVILTSNLFGDILSDLSAILTGSIGILPSASLGEGERGLYEPVHGSAPDIAGQGRANPLAAILSVAMLLRHSLQDFSAAERVERAVERALLAGYRTADLATEGETIVSTAEMGNQILAELEAD